MKARLLIDISTRMAWGQIGKRVVMIDAEHLEPDLHASGYSKENYEKAKAALEELAREQL